MDPWLSIEVCDGDVPASDWRRAHADTLVGQAIADRAVRWSWRVLERGVAFDVTFRTEEIRDEFRTRPAVRAVLDAVPDPERGLTILGLPDTSPR